MKSATKKFERLMERVAIKRNKKGAMGLDQAKVFMFALMTLAILGFVTIIILSALNNSGVTTAGSLERNLTTSVLNNVSIATGTFFGNSATWFALIAVVVIILIVAVVIFAVNNFGAGARQVNA